MRVLVADDDPRVLQALVEVLEATPGIEVVAAARDAAEAIRAAMRTVPEVALIDVRMPEGGGVQATRQILRCAAATTVIALSASEDAQSVLEMLRAGARGYLVKGRDSDEIVTAIRGAARGEAMLSNAVTGAVIAELTDRLDREQTAVVGREDLRERFRRIIANHRFAIVFQPIVSLAGGRAVGVEALTRIKMTPPRTPDVWFVEAASVGMSVALERAVVREAVGHVSHLLEHAGLSVNVSPEALVSPSFRDACAGVDLRRVTFEITEHAPVDDYRRLLGAIDDFRAGGARLGVDDVGAGVSSLRHVTMLKPDVVKLDRSLVGELTRAGGGRSLVRGVTSFAADLGAVVVAEGIETRDDLDCLRDLGVHLGQGRYWGPPAACGRCSS